MRETTKIQPAQGAFQKGRWMIDSDGTGVAAGSVNQQPIDTDGDGVADTLALRVEAQQPKRRWIGVLGAWFGRFVVTIVVVAALVVAGMSITSTYYQRQDVQRMQREVASFKAEATSAQTQVRSLEKNIATLEEWKLEQKQKLVNATSENAQLQVEVGALRTLLVGKTTTPALSQ